MKTTKKKFYKDDNLSEKEKKRVIRGIPISLIILLVIVFFIVKRKNDQNDLLTSKNYLETISKVVGRSATKLNGDIFQYKVDGKVFEHHNINSLTRNLGELYKIRYSPEDPQICVAILSSPVILDFENYDVSKCIINETETELKPNRIRLSYKYMGKNYKRNLYIKDASKYYKNEEHRLLINKQNPKISYLKDMFE